MDKKLQDLMARLEVISDVRNRDRSNFVTFTFEHPTVSTPPGELVVRWAIIVAQLEPLSELGGPLPINLIWMNFDSTSADYKRVFKRRDPAPNGNYRSTWIEITTLDEIFEEPQYFVFDPSLIGATGPKGERGEKGDQGEKGDTGADSTVVGPQGRQGERGPIGPQGPQGERGTDGNVGEKGERGFKGDKGETGSQGATGVQGPKGETGNAGAQGVRGDTGEKGTTGDIGPRGERGEKGEQGVPGQPGQRGAFGETGLQGPQGEVGPRGNDGAQGPQGPQGPQGIPGARGNDGTSITAFPLDLSAQHFGRLTASFAFCRFVFDRDVHVTDNLVGSTAYADIAPAARCSVSLYKNDTHFGNVTFEAGSKIGSYSGFAVNFAPGDRLTIYGPAAADPSFADSTYTIKAQYLN